MLREEVEFITGILIDYKTQPAPHRILNASMYKNVETFLEGDLVHLLPLHASSLHTVIVTFCEGYMGPLVIDILLDSINYKLKDLENRVLVDIFHINRLQLALVSISTGTATTQLQLNITFNGVTCIEEHSNEIELLTQK